MDNKIKKQQPQEVWISIKSRQREENDDNEIELSTYGQMCRDGDGYTLTYEESETTGMEGVTTSIFVTPSMVTLERRGTMNSLMVMEKGRRTMCNYDTGYGNLTMGIYANAITSNLTEHGGDFHFQYTLDINSGIASVHDVSVRVQTTDYSQS